MLIIGLIKIDTNESINPPIIKTSIPPCTCTPGKASVRRKRDNALKNVMRNIFFMAASRTGHYTA
jgi:hypothetical protein